MPLRGPRKGIKPSAILNGAWCSLEFSGLGAGEIKRHPHVETVLVTGDKRTEVMRKVLDWLMEGVN
jgi:hypothetical protein